MAKIQPDPGFVNEARERLMHRIYQENESWLKAFLKKLGHLAPPALFVQEARQRLVVRISHAAPHRIMFSWLQKAMAGVMALLLIVIPTLFFVDGGQYVNASQESSLQVIAGQVLVQHAGHDNWQSVEDKIVLKTGDTLQLNSNSQATLSFFDDSQLRLTDRATVIVNKLDPLARHETGLAEVSLMGGRAWAQVINLPDGYKSLTVRTPDAVIGADDAVFDTIVDPQGATQVRVFKSHVLAGALHEKTGTVLTQIKIDANQQIKVQADTGSDGMRANPLELAVYKEPWVRDNSTKDELHLNLLQKREIALRAKSAGVLPGHFLYPVKQIEEGIMKAFAFTQDSQNQVQLSLANKRLNEAIVLLNQRQYDRAQEALMAYQSIARQIANEAQNDQSLRTRVQSELIARNSKSLVAALPTADITIVREAINATEEMIVSDPLEREELRLENITDSLAQLQDFVASGNIDAAKEVLVAYETLESNILSEGGKLQNLDQRKALFNRILELRNEAAGVFQTLQKEFALDEVNDGRFVALLQSASQTTEREINKVASLIEPLLPTATVVPAPTQEEQRVADFVGNVEIYQTWRGQKNEIKLLLSRLGRDAKDIDFLAKLRLELQSPLARDFINSRILELKQKARINKSKAVERKIDQARAGR